MNSIISKICIILYIYTCYISILCIYTYIHSYIHIYIMLYTIYVYIVIYMYIVIFIYPMNSPISHGFSTRH